MSKVEPLIKEVEEKLYIGNDSLKKNTNGLLIRTILASIIVTFFTFRSLYAFYIGFTHYEERFKKEETKIVQRQSTNFPDEADIKPQLLPVISTEEPNPIQIPQLNESDSLVTNKF